MNPVFEKFSNLSIGSENETIHSIDTPYGNFSVTVIGELNRPALLTLHDIGLNHRTNFEHFFNLPEMRVFASHFRIVHVDVPGQTSNSMDMPCPDMRSIDLALDTITEELGIRSFVGLGQGAGAYVLSMFALRKPDEVCALILFNASGEACSWTDYTSFTMNALSLKRWGLTNGVTNFLRWYHCGCVNEYADESLIMSYDERFASMNERNLSSWLQSYAGRPNLGISRTTTSQQPNMNFSCPVLLIVGRLSPHLESSRKLYSLCDIQKVCIFEIDDCRSPLDEAPRKVLESMSCHLQGAGYPLNKLRKLFTSMRKEIHDSICI